MINQNDRSKTFLGVLLIRPSISLDQVKSMRTKLIALSILLMLLVSPLSGIVYAEEDPTDPTDPPVNPEGDGEGDGDGNIDPVLYEQIQQQAQDTFHDLYELMFGAVLPEPVDPEGDGEELPEYAGPEIPEDVDPALANQFMNAWSAMQSAEEKENPRAAANQYLRAMKQLMNAYKKFQKDNPEVVEALTEGDGVPQNEVPVGFTEGELDAVQKELVERFQVRFQGRLTEMFQNFNDVENNLSPSDAVKAFDALTKAEAKLLRIQEKIDAGEIDGALDDLDDTGDELGDGLDSLDDDRSAQMLRTMLKLEARIGKMEERAERKAARGEDTSGDDAAIANARGNKDKAKNDFNNGKGQGNSGNGGKPDKDKGKPDKDKGNQGQGNN